MPGQPQGMANNEPIRVESDAHESLGAGSRGGETTLAGNLVHTATVPEAVLRFAPPMYVADRNRTVTFATPSFAALARALGLPPIVSGSTITIAGELALALDRLNSGPLEVTLSHTVTVDGTVRHLRSRHSSLVEDGVLVGYCGVFQDVTPETQALAAATHADERYVDLIRATSDWTWEVDEHFNLTDVSPQIAGILDLPPSSLVGRHLFTLGRFEDEEHTAHRLMREASYAPFRGRIFLMGDASGRERRVALSAVPVFDETSGRFTGYRGTGIDVTSRVEATERARAYQQELEANLDQLRERNMQLDVALEEARAAARAKTEFLGKMSHELRTPLNAIIGFSEMSIQQVFGALSERYLGYFRDIRGAAHHLLNIIDDILDAVHIEANRVSIVSEPVRVAQIIAEARSIVAVRAERANIDFGAVTFNGDWTVMADSGRLRQILVNLLNNAVKYTKQGGKVGVAVERGTEGWLDIMVWDTGIGIARDQQALIFESFHQVGSNLMTGPREGVGLGLTISRQLARLMGGDILVDSTPGAGSRFTVRLPVMKQG
jgi:PAS domain S-box-containing protein